MNTALEKQLKFKLSGGLRFLITLILIIIAGSSLSSSQGTTSVASTSPGTAIAPAAPSQPPMQVSAIVLNSDYSSNEVAADAKYKGKVLDVSGTIDTIGKDITGTPYVTLKTGEYSPFSVQCMFSDADDATLEKLSSDQAVTLQGTVVGKPLNVELDGCSVVN